MPIQGNIFVHQDTAVDLTHYRGIYENSQHPDKKLKLIHVNGKITILDIFLSDQDVKDITNYLIKRDALTMEKNNKRDEIFRFAQERRIRDEKIRKEKLARMEEARKEDIARREKFLAKRVVYRPSFSSDSDSEEDEVCLTEKEEWKMIDETRKKRLENKSEKIEEGKGE